RQVKNIFGSDIYFTSAEDLILIKLQWFKESESSRQKEDIISILKITSIDEAYIEKMTKELDVAEVWKQVKEEYKK
ncbi:MAG: hypothetical protein HYY61_06135, partial [Deltaproteobacteria bacterium]|nr:hypothetical protein [Deltaproteobacteria bacterium]